LLLLEGRAIWELAALFASIPWVNRAPRGDGHPVLVLPGLGAGDASTYALRRFLKSRGYATHGWGLGRNYGLRPGLEEQMVQRLKDLRREHERKVSLIGWSLGGVFARELARKAPDDVRLVISLGSPFTGHPKATNAWRFYEFLSGQKVGDPELHATLRPPPPVPTTSIFSRSDGIVAWQCSVEAEGPLTENIEVKASHLGLGHNPAVLYAIANRMAQPEGQWSAFDGRGLKRLLYPDPRRADRSKK
jgi:pimeloyl-ACP methyl ester carboxylesterase